MAMMGVVELMEREKQRGGLREGGCVTRVIFRWVFLGTTFVRHLGRLRGERLQRRVFCGGEEVEMQVGKVNRKLPTGFSSGNWGKVTMVYEKMRSGKRRAVEALTSEAPVMHMMFDPTSWMDPAKDGGFGVGGALNGG